MGYKRHKQQERLTMAKKRGLYENINRRKKAGTSRSKKDSTIDPKIYKKMKEKKGGFKPKKKKATTKKRKVTRRKK